MKKMFNKAVLNGTTVMGDGLTYPRIPNVYTGDNEGGYQRGDMMDANAVVEMIKELTDTGKITIEELQNLINEEIQERVEGDQDQQRYTDQKIKDLIGTSPETLDTLKEIADALGEDPDFAANVWNKIAELTTKHNEDVQELQDAITSGFENIDFTPYVKKTDVVTDTTNGLMLASDKVKLDSFEEAEQYTKAPNLPDSVISNIEQVSTYRDKDIIFKCTKNNLIDGSSSEFNMIVPAATSWSAGVIQAEHYNKISGVPIWSIASDREVNIRVEYEQNRIDIEYPVHFISIYGSSSDTTKWFNLEQATHSLGGVMSAQDKVKLDSLVNYRAGNGINITGDTISCTLDTSLYSIVTELPETGLPNKIYLLPSTKTEEGNIYTEYGYVDNKWEELGKYKVDVDLSPYERALHLPSDVVKALGVQSGANYVNVYSYKQDLDRGRLSEVSEFDIPKATSEKAGIITAQDKVKLDGIEAGAQVNKIESVSVNGTPLEITNKGVNIPIHEYTAEDGIKLENGKFSLDTIEHTERSYTTKLIGPKEEPALNIPIVDESGKLNKNILIPNVADLSDRTPTEWTGEIDDLGCIRYEDYKNISDYYYNFTKNIFFCPIQDNQLLMYNIGKGIDNDKLNDFLKNPDNYDNWNIPVAIYLSDGLLASGGLYGEVPVYDPNDDSKVYYPGGVFGFKVNIDESKNNLLTFTEGEDYTDGFSPAIVNTKKLIVPKQSVIDTIVNSNEFKAKQDVLVSGDGINISEGVVSTTPISIKTEKFSFVNSGSHQPTYNYSGVTIYDDRYISGTKYGIAFDEADIVYRGVITSPDGVRTVCFALDQSVRRKIDSIDGKENMLNFKSTSYLTYSRSGSSTDIDIKDDIKTLIDSISGKQDALTEVQLNNINNAITSISINNIEQVNTNGAVNLTIPNATTSKDGMMSKADKTKLDSLENYTLPAATTTTLGGVKVPENISSDNNIDRINSIRIWNGEIYSHPYIKYKSSNKKLILCFNNPIGPDWEVSEIDCADFIKDGPNASITENGLMSKEDKTKLDSQPTIKASNATGVTDNDYVVIKKSEYQSVLDRLSALENKA